MAARRSALTRVQAFRFSDIHTGQTKSRRYSLTKDVYESFLTGFQDMSPIHVDDGFAQKKGFKSKLMHGAILNGFTSHFIGVCFPGKYAVLQSVNMQYRAPVYLGDHLRLVCRVDHKSQATKTLSLSLTWFRADTETIVATAKVQTGVTA